MTTDFNKGPMISEIIIYLSYYLSFENLLKLTFPTKNISITSIC